MRGGGTIHYTADDGGHLAIIQRGGDLSLSGFNISAPHSGGVSIYGGTTTLSDMSVVAGEMHAVRVSGDDANVTINSGSYRMEGTGAYCAASLRLGTVTINGGTFRTPNKTEGAVVHLGYKTKSGSEPDPVPDNSRALGIEVTVNNINSANNKGGHAFFVEGGAYALIKNGTFTGCRANVISSGGPGVYWITGGVAKVGRSYKGLTCNKRALKTFSAQRWPKTSTAMNNSHWFKHYCSERCSMHVTGGTFWNNGTSYAFHTEGNDSTTYNGYGIHVPSSSSVKAFAREDYVVRPNTQDILLNSGDYYSPNSLFIDSSNEGGSCRYNHVHLHSGTLAEP